MLDLKDRYGATIVVPVIFSETSSGYELNIVPSMYPKSDEKTKMPRDHWFTEQVHNGLVLYKNTKKNAGLGPNFQAPIAWGGIPIPTNKRYILKLI